jgi:nucleoside phosphorylase
MDRKFLFVTANDNEKEAFLSYFKNANADGFVDGVRYRAGMFGNYPAVHLHLQEMGNDSPNSTPLIEKLVRELGEADTEIVGVVMVGIAYGIDEDNQKIGDVLVASKILNVDRKKEDNGNTEFKDEPKDTGRVLINAFCDTEDWNFDIGGNSAKVHCGLIMSGGTLVDDYKYRQNLIETCKVKYPQLLLIGGEMEGYGLYSVCDSVRLLQMYILIKGICDWGYDKQNANKEEHQKIAANAAVSLCHAVFSRNGIFDKIIGKTKKNLN